MESVDSWDTLDGEWVCMSMYVCVCVCFFCARTCTCVVDGGWTTMRGTLQTYNACGKGRG